MAGQAAQTPLTPQPVTPGEDPGQGTPAAVGSSHIQKMIRIAKACRAGREYYAHPPNLATPAKAGVHARFNNDGIGRKPAGSRIKPKQADIAEGTQCGKIKRSSRKSHVTMPKIERHLLDRGDGLSVELYQAVPDRVGSMGAMLFVHGNQGGQLLGAREAVESGMLMRFSSGLNIVAAAVSQPGFGASDGPPDFCGPSTQLAIESALSFLRKQPQIDPDLIVLSGNSRGAVASAMVATRETDLRTVILTAGVYDLKAAYDHSPRGLQWVIEREAGLADEAFSARSALHHAHLIRSEVVLLHGRHDERGPVIQAEQFSKALSDAGNPVTLHVFECGHRIPTKHSGPALRPFLGAVFKPATRH